MKTYEVTVKEKTRRKEPESLKSVKVSIRMTPAEHNRLKALAEWDRRKTSDEIILLINEEYEKRGQKHERNK